MSGNKIKRQLKFNLRNQISFMVGVVDIVITIIKTMGEIPLIDLRTHQGIMNMEGLTIGLKKCPDGEFNSPNTLE